MHTFRVRVVSQASSLQEGVIEARGGGRGKGGSLDTGGGEVERLRRREGGEGKEEKKERRRRRGKIFLLDMLWEGGKYMKLYSIKWFY